MVDVTGRVPLAGHTVGPGAQRWPERHASDMA